MLSNTKAKLKFKNPQTFPLIFKGKSDKLSRPSSSNWERSRNTRQNGKLSHCFDGKDRIVQKILFKIFMDTTQKILTVVIYRLVHQGLPDTNWSIILCVRDPRTWTQLVLLAANVSLTCLNTTNTLQSTMPSVLVAFQHHLWHPPVECEPSASFLFLTAMLMCWTFRDSEDIFFHFHLLCFHPLSGFLLRSTVQAFVLLKQVTSSEEQSWRKSHKNPALHPPRFLLSLPLYVWVHAGQAYFKSIIFTIFNKEMVIVHKKTDYPPICFYTLFYQVLGCVSNKWF